MTFRLAVAQAPGSLDSVNQRLDWLAGVLPEVAAHGADLILLPELFACGYNIGAAVVERAEQADGPTAQTMSGLAAWHGVAIHYGFAETAGDALFNSAVCFGPEGIRLSLHRKLAIPPGFERTYFRAGQGCDLFEFGGLKIATLICYDAEFPETVRHVAALGAELVLVPTALGAQWGWVADTMIPTRAYENGVFLAYANSAGAESGLDYLGRSVIAAPDGQELARADAEATIIYADIDRARVDAAQRRLPYLEDRRKLNL